ncbi:hypothetical protein QCA50_002568 [Cerrena zonata]|uniref:Uncharacterized protein n=1 Tax=Cerrena zonata TaxID=2478898 RepID=A0AAW0GS29_9APHY
MTELHDRFCRGLPGQDVHTDTIRMLKDEREEALEVLFESSKKRRDLEHVNYCKMYDDSLNQVPRDAITSYSETSERTQHLFGYLDTAI